MQENINPRRPKAPRRTKVAAREAARLSEPKRQCRPHSTRRPTAACDVSSSTAIRPSSASQAGSASPSAPEVDELAARKPKPTSTWSLGCTDGVANVVEFPQRKSEMKAHADEVATHKRSAGFLAPPRVIDNFLAGNVASVVKAAEAADGETEPEARRARSRASTSTRCLPRARGRLRRLFFLESWDR